MDEDESSNKDSIFPPLQKFQIPTKIYKNSKKQKSTLSTPMIPIQNNSTANDYNNYTKPLQIKPSN